MPKNKFIFRVVLEKPEHLHQYLVTYLKSELVLDKNYMPSKNNGEYSIITKIKIIFKNIFVKF